MRTNSGHGAVPPNLSIDRQLDHWNRHSTSTGQRRPGFPVHRQLRAKNLTGYFTPPMASDRTAENGDRRTTADPIGCTTHGGLDRLDYRIDLSPLYLISIEETSKRNSPAHRNGSAQRNHPNRTSPHDTADACTFTFILEPTTQSMRRKWEAPIGDLEPSKLRGAVPYPYTIGYDVEVSTRLENRKVHITGTTFHPQTLQGSDCRYRGEICDARLSRLIDLYYCNGTTIYRRILASLCRRGLSLGLLKWLRGSRKYLTHHAAATPHKLVRAYRGIRAINRHRPDNFNLLSNR